MLRSTCEELQVIPAAGQTQFLLELLSLLLPVLGSPQYG